MYATAAIIGRIGFYLPSVLVFVLFPEAARIMESGGNWRRPFITSMLLTAALALSFAFVCGFFPGMVVSVLYGKEYLSAAGLLRVISIAMACLAMANVVFANSLAREEYGFIYIQCAGMVFLIVAVFFSHASPMDIALDLLGAVAFMLVCSLGWITFLWRRRN